MAANVRACPIWRRDPEKNKSRIRVVRIGRDVLLDLRPTRLRHMFRQPGLALHDPFCDLARGHVLAGYGIAISSLLKRLFHGYFTRAALVGHRQGFFHYDVKYGAS